ncbi:SusD/RagB family nutrient-binding outer membrane lipoprotein [Neolewinella sp.]|uniref:SusD/RagB family nutrient-binding outer membrane lipoprotein n=1 Tax=Neolewinella sp. TaxID=2993543 RepID=UPI003B51BCA8
MKLLQIIVFGLCAVFIFSNCADLDELLVNPNGVDASEADAESLYNSVQLTFNDVQNDPYFFAAGLARMDAETGGFTYTATHQATEFDGMWSDIYAKFLPDADAFINIVEPLGLDAAAASAKIMKAYVYMQVVDLFGDVPYSEAGQGGSEVGVLNPTRDPGSDVYAQAVALLDEAIIQLDSAADFDIAYDNFYGGSASRWETLARTLKLRAAITTRLVGGGSSIQSLVDDGDLIDQNNENWEWKYGTNRNNPNNRHPFYNDSYEAEDGAYQSNWYMWLLAESKGFPDPRTRYYFYRQDRNVFPDAVAADPNAFDCIFTSLPDPDVLPPQYEAVSEDIPYCLGSYSMSYFGRDHLNGSGIPPDGQYRTLFGLYPAGGLYDDATTNRQQSGDGTDGAQGGGIEPIWQASFTHFVLAEAALTGSYDGDARELLADGIQLSIDRVRQFEDKVNGSEVIATVPVEVTVEDTYVTDTMVTEYIDFVMDQYDAVDDGGKLAIVAREYLIALYGNGLEAYNLYRRTCLPRNIQPGIDPNPGPFIRSALYPSVYINRNLNAEQKGNFTEPVFWDTNDASCNY